MIENSAKQQIPGMFERKMEIDDAISAIVDNEVVSLAKAKKELAELKKDREFYRRSCADYVTEAMKDMRGKR